MTNEEREYWSGKTADFIYKTAVRRDRSATHNVADREYQVNERQINDHFAKKFQRIPINGNGNDWTFDEAFIEMVESKLCAKPEAIKAIGCVEGGGSDEGCLYVFRVKLGERKIK